MLLEIGEGDHRQKWHLHFHTTLAESDEVRAAKNLPPLLWAEETTCYVHTGVCVLSYATPKYCVNGQAGLARTSKKDQFLKSQGAKLALARALKKMPSVPKSIRKAIWDAYWAKVRRPKEKPDKFRKRIGVLGAQATKAAQEVLDYLKVREELAGTYSSAEADVLIRPILNKVATIIDSRLYRR
jgi:hypothetical protein